MSLTSLWAHFISFVFPAYCEGCGRQIFAPGWCEECSRLLRPLGPCCPKCARPVTVEDHLCGTCAKSPPPFQRVWVSLAYQGLWAEALKKFKYQKALWLLRPLARKWQETLAFPLPHVDVVIPVPLHVKRLRTRGFNQSSLLARAIFGPSLVKEYLLRHRDTPPQVELGLHQRRANVKGAFSLAQGISVKGQKVLIFDDVMTTGATARECAQVLKKAGAAKIYVAVLARAG